jgi:hypothetical protein
MRDSRFDEMFDFPLNNVECHHLYLFEPDVKYAPVWTVNVILNENLAKSMKDIGFNVREKDFKNGSGEVSYIVAKRKTITAKQKPMFPPRIVGPDAKLWDAQEIIGNGSIMNLQVAAMYCTVNGQEHLPLYLNGAQVVKHVPYTASSFKPLEGSEGTGEDVPF